MGVFRPVVREGEPDELLTVLTGLATTDAPAEKAWGVTYDTLAADPESAMATILDRYHDVARGQDAMLVVGSDYDDAPDPTEFTTNAQLAADLGVPLLLVIPAGERSQHDVVESAAAALAAARARYAHVVGVVFNHVAPRLKSSLDARIRSRTTDVDVWSIAESRSLGAPTVAELAAACHGRLVHGDPELMDRECLGMVVAAMSMRHVIDHLFDDGVVIVPGDREDVVLGVLLAHHSRTLPNLSGLILNGGFRLSPQIDRLIDGLDIRLPMIRTSGSTMQVAADLSAVEGRITPQSTRKIREAVALVEQADGLADVIGRRRTGDAVVTPLMFEHDIMERAKQVGAHIVLPEGSEPRILRAARQILDHGIAELTLLGDAGTVRAVARDQGLDVSAAHIVDPAQSPWREGFAQDYASLRAHKGVTLDMAYDRVVDPSYFGTMMVRAGHADGMVSGCITTTANTIRPALEVIRTAPGVSVVSSVFLMCLADRVLVYGDCAVNPDPTSEQLADIAISSARTAADFGIDPRVAMLSYSTGLSGAGADVEKVREATRIVREKAPDLLVEGPIQYDAAVEPEVARTKLPDSRVAGRATVLIFPDLNTGNNTYKAVQRSSSALAIGPVLQGLNRPVNDLSRGALVRDIVNTIAITAVQAARARAGSADRG